MTGVLEEMWCGFVVGVWGGRREACWSSVRVEVACWCFFRVEETCWVTGAVQETRWSSVTVEKGC